MHTSHACRPLYEREKGIMIPKKRILFIFILIFHMILPVNAFAFDDFDDWVGKVSASAVHTLAINHDGTLWGWGSCMQGQLGPRDYRCCTCADSYSISDGKYDTNESKNQV